MYFLDEKPFFTWIYLEYVVFAKKMYFWMNNLFYLEYVVFDKKMYFSDEKLIVPGICCCLRWRESSHTWEVQSVTIGTKHSDNTIRTIIIINTNILLVEMVMFKYNKDN